MHTNEGENICVKETTQVNEDKKMHTHEGEEVFVEVQILEPLGPWISYEKPMSPSTIGVLSNWFCLHYCFATFRISKRIFYW